MADARDVERGGRGTQDVGRWTRDVGCMVCDAPRAIKENGKMSRTQPSFRDLPVRFLAFSGSENTEILSFEFDTVAYLTEGRV